MNITLSPGEKLYLNGAVIRVTRKVVIELLSDATFLLESHIMQAHEANTPMRQIYFSVQIMLMDPRNSAPALRLAKHMIGAAMGVYRNPIIIGGLDAIVRLVETERYFDALKLIRGLYAEELMEMSPDIAVDQNCAA